MQVDSDGRELRGEPGTWTKQPNGRLAGDSGRDRLRPMPELIERFAQDFREAVIPRGGEVMSARAAGWHAITVVVHVGDTGEPGRSRRSGGSTDLCPGSDVSTSNEVRSTLWFRVKSQRAWQ
jgi:hypothetical protein